MRVASNTGPIIHLAQIHGLFLLKELYGEVLITDEVRREAVNIGEKERCPDVILIENAIQKRWIKIVNSGERKEEFIRFGIHQAEAEIISYALEENVDLILLDDDAAREVARTLSLEVRGSIGILIEALKKNKISKRKALKMLDRLTDVMYLNSEVYKTARDSVELI